MSDEVETQEVLDRPRGVKKILALGLVGAIVFLGAAVFLLRPYARIERLAEGAFSRHAPPGSTIGAISVGFPMDIVLTGLSVPVRVQNREREIRIEKLRGGVSLLPLLLGELKVGMRSDFFGGTMWLDLTVDSPAALVEAGSSGIAFDARARGVDIARMGGFLASGQGLSGRCDADLKGRLDERDLRTLSGGAVAMGRGIRIPVLYIAKAIIPENHDVDFSARLSAKEGKIFIDSLRLDGAAYDLSGEGAIVISEPFESSPIDGSFSVVFKTPPTIDDPRLGGPGIRLMLNALVESGTAVPFKLFGDVRKPQARIDVASLIGSFQQNRR